MGYNPNYFQGESVVFSIKELYDGEVDVLYDIYLTNFRLFVYNQMDDSTEIHKLNDIIIIEGKPNIDYNIKRKSHFIDLYFTDGKTHLIFDKHQSVYVKDFLDKLTYYTFGKSMEILPAGASSSESDSNKTKFGLFKRK